MCTILLSCAMRMSLRVDKKLQFLPYRVNSIFALFGTAMLGGQSWNTSVPKSLHNHLLDTA